MKLCPQTPDGPDDASTPTLSERPVPWGWDRGRKCGVGVGRVLLGRLTWYSSNVVPLEMCERYGPTGRAYVLSTVGPVTWVSTKGISVAGEGSRSRRGGIGAQSPELVTVWN